MPQSFHIVRCFECETFQVQIVKKSNKWECKLCGKKQSLKKVFFEGTGKECRVHVQELNQLRGIKDNLKSSVEETYDGNEEHNQRTPVHVTSENSKWNKYINDSNSVDQSVSQDLDTDGDVQYVLEMPKKKRKLATCGENNKRWIEKPKGSYKRNYCCKDDSQFKPQEKPNDVIGDLENDNHYESSVNTSNDLNVNCFKKSAETCSNSNASLQEGTDSQLKDDSKFNNIKYENAEKIHCNQVGAENSKWTKYLQSQNNDECDKDNLDSSSQNRLSQISNNLGLKDSNKLTITSHTGPKYIFSSCNESELDDILTI